MLYIIKNIQCVFLIMPEHPIHHKNDPYHRLSRQEQVIIFRLVTNHNRLRHDMYSKFKVGLTNQCTCGNEPEAADHVLETCNNYADLKL